MKSIKNYILKSLGISSMNQQLADCQDELREIKKNLETLENRLDDLEGRFESYIHPAWDCNEFYKRIKLLQHNRDEMKQRLTNLETVFFAENRGLNKTDRKPRLIVSFTSFPARIGAVSAVFEQMLRQTVKPDEIVLWLSKEQFPRREEELPKELLEYKKYGVKIEWCDGDIKAYKKFIPSLKKYSEDLIVIIDDDLIYPIDLLEKLYEAHKRFPESIIASRVHEIAMDENGKIARYRKWKKQIGEDVYQARAEWFFTGGAGTLLPPHIFAEEIFNEQVIQQLCPWADDIWLNIHAAMNHVPVVNIAANHKLARYEETQEVCLQDINQQQNDVQLKNLVMHYREQLVGTIYEKM